ncbi:hypothetical protein HPB50_014781 [Hyalomma asiaticum]|uniref:Uncharacterized protein n=1 Tax=Hyalomma asiaticum TaxID=266040 RepID=A0ACB7S0U3_HYAAI|nr:hypothetical protein HPB50_014781 [Hyalomma asiaticum]
MASGTSQSLTTISEHSADGARQREPLGGDAPNASYHQPPGGPFKHRLSSCGGGSEMTRQALSSPSSPSVPKHETAAAHVEVGSTSLPSPLPSSRQADVVGCFKDVRRLPPVFSCDEDRWSSRSMSRLFSQSTFGYEFDRASLSHHVSSLAGDRHLCAHVCPCQRHTLLMFLVAVLVACVTAVVVDMRWTALAHNRWTQFLADEDFPAVESPVEGNTSALRPAYLSWTTGTGVEPSPRVNEGESFDDWTKWDSPADNVTVAPGVQRETDIATGTAKPSRIEVIRTRGRNRTVASTGGIASLPRRPGTARRRHTRRPGALRRDKKSRPHRNVMSAPIRRPTKHKCGLAFYTYCSTFRHEAYYRHTTRSCVRTITDDVHVCNHSPNRFTSLTECRRKCVHAQLPSDACFEKTLFSWCNRRDVRASWWVFDGRRCRPWSFPKGLCPSVDESDLFGSLDECVRQCSPQEGLGDEERKERCRGPGRGVTCESNVLRFPYFADVSPGTDGRVRCIRASAATLLTHRCLVGSNRFSSDDACKRACVDGATLRRRMKIES